MMGAGALGMPLKSSAAGSDIKLVTFKGDSGTVTHENQRANEWNYEQTNERTNEQTN